MEKIHQRNIENKEKAIKAKDNFKNKLETKQYNYERLEEEFRLKQQQMEDEKLKLETIERLKRKNNLRPIRREDLDEFQKTYLEKRQELSMQKDKERILKTEELFNINSKMLKPDNDTYKKIVQDEKNLIENEEKKKVEKIYKSLKIKNFSKVVKDNLLPKIDEYKKKEIKDRINKNKLPPHPSKKAYIQCCFKEKEYYSKGWRNRKRNYKT